MRARGAASRWLWLLCVLLGCHAARAPSAALPVAAREAPPLWGSPRPGPWDVGLQVLAVPGKAGSRPLQVSVWYPSRAPGEAPRLRYRDYVALTGTEEQPESSGDARAGEEAVARYRQLLTENGVPGPAVASWLGASVMAVRDSPRVPERFPLVLVAQGRFHSAHHQAVLSEYLASHGFVVATTPFPPRAAPPMTDEAVLADARAQEEDLERALGALRTREDVDASRLALVGHSFGARSAFLLALRHPEARALVSLDGGIANSQGKAWLTSLEGFRPEAFHAALLHLYQEGDEMVTPDFALIESLRGSERWLSRVAGLRHRDFTSVGAAVAVAPELAPPGEADGTTRGWALTAEATRYFLDAELRGDTGAWETFASHAEVRRLRAR